MISNSREKDIVHQSNQEGENNNNQQQEAAGNSSRQWSGFRNPRIVRVSRSFGGKDRHSKVCTIRGLRDRRIRLSVPTAIQLYDLQDRLGLGQPSKVIDWLLDATKLDIDKLPPLQPFPHQFHDHHHQSNPPSLINPFFDANINPPIYKCVEEHSVPDRIPVVDFDFDETKIVGLVGTRICIWRRNGKRSIFPSSEGTFVKGLCMRYYDPEAVVGCEDGTARVFDMYSRKCSRIIRMHAGPVKCLSASDDQLILSGSSLGSITVSGILSDQRVATLRSTDSTGIRSLCHHAGSHLVFAGSTAGYTSCWDLRTMRSVWETRVSPNVVYSVQHLRNDTSTLVVGGIDGVLRILDQNTGQVLSSCIMEGKMLSSSQNTHGGPEGRKGRRVSEEIRIDSIPKSARPPITCLAVGMKKVVTTHNSRYIRLWKFNN